MSNFKVNENKKITIIRENVNATSWKKNLSSILEGKYSKASEHLISNYSGFDVSNEVDLFLGDTYPTISFSFGTTEPMKDFIKELENNWLSGLPSGTLKAISKGKKVLEGGINLISAATSATSDTATSKSWSPWILNIKAYDPEKGASTISITNTFKFSMGQYGLWNAKEEVVAPILNLIAPTIPQYVSSFMISGPIPTGVDLLAKVTANIFGEASSFFKKVVNKIKSDDATSETSEGETLALSDTFSFKNLGNTLEGLTLGTYQDFLYTVTFGNFLTLYHVMIKSASIRNLSSETDQNGYPISGEVELSFEGIVPIALASSSSRNLAVRFMSK